MIISSHRRGGALGLMVALALAAIAAAPAAAAVPVSARPPAFTLTAVGASGNLLMHGTAGQLLHGSVSVRNLSPAPITVVLRPADIQNSGNGSAAFVTTSLSHTGRWVHLAAGAVRLAPHATRQVSFTVSVPAAATGASHYGGIVALNAADLSATASLQPGKRTSLTFRDVIRVAQPITIRLPGPLTRSLALHSVKFAVAPVGASLRLGLLPDGTVLIESAKVSLRILRGSRTVFTYSSTLGQLFPDSNLNYNIPWQGQPTPGSYRVVGTIRPQGAPVLKIDTTVKFTAGNAAQLKRVTPPVPPVRTTSVPGWVWIVLAFGAALLLALLVTVYRLARRRSRPDARTRPSDGAANDSDPVVDAHTDDSSHTEEPGTARTYSGDD